MFEEDGINAEGTQSTNDGATEYIEALREIRRTTVPRADYDRVVQEKTELITALANGQSVEAEQSEEIDVGALRADLFSAENEMSNLEYVTKALKLREGIMKNGGPDPFVPQSRQYNPTEADYAAAARVADVFQQCVDYAQGDSAVFTNELMRRTNDVMLPRR